MARRHDSQALQAELLAFALGLPDAEIDHPWGDTVVKVNAKKKIFVFLGGDDPDADHAMSVKLVESHEQALQGPGTSPTGYGLGRAGWVSIELGAAVPPVGVLEDWIEESYRQVALKKWIKALDEQSG